MLDEEQQKALSKLDNGKILCGDVGSGKSRVALAYFNQRIEAPADLKFLYIITTASKRNKHEWENECVEMGLDLTMVIVDSWNNIKKYETVVDGFFIFDEQKVSGSGTWSKTFIKITKQNKWILLSATPGDTWSDYIPVFVANGFYRNRTDFLRQHAIYSRYTKYPRIDRYTDEKALRRHLQGILVPMPVRRHTTPHRAHRIVNYPIAEYSTLLKTMFNPYTSEPIKNNSEFFFLMRKLVNSDPSRMDAIRSLLVDHTTAIVFYNFDFELVMLRGLEDDGFLVGEWNSHRHDTIPHGDKWVYLVQYNAGSDGWNCIETDTIIFYSLNYSHRMKTQAEGRINRRNTPFGDLYYYTLRSNSKIDLMILAALKKKSDFNEKSWKGSLPEKLEKE